MGMQGLTVKQERYVQNLFKGMTQRQAYKAAYNAEKMTDKSIDEKACELAANVKVSARLKFLIDAVALDTIITKQQILTELANIALANGSDYAEVVQKESIDTEGSPTGRTYSAVMLKPTDNISQEKRSAIAVIEQTTSGIRVKQHDKVKALELCGKYHGMWVDKVETEHSGSVTVEQYLGAIAGEEY